MNGDKMVLTDAGHRREKGNHTGLGKTDSKHSETELRLHREE